VAADQAFGHLREWLVSEGAVVTHEEPPAPLQARHGRRLQPKGWAKDARKSVEFRITAQGAGSAVEATVWPGALNAGDLVSMREEAHANWAEWLDGAWAGLGAAAAGAKYAKLGARDWQAQYTAGRKRMVRGRSTTVATLAAVACVIAVVQSMGLLLTQFQASLALAGPGALLTWSVTDWIAGWSSVREARRRLRP
jgi:hypothetical protein